ncbi:MAG: hypothetical protein HY520_00235 [Candidatus Aenigmarchaeota archaeon]|nr:hypothetical protein [Candidatus Aenigmarchaeota archaeon]
MTTEQRASWSATHPPPRPRPTLTQGGALRARDLRLRLELLSALHGGTIAANCTCDGCGEEIDLREAFAANARDDRGVIAFPHCERGSARIWIHAERGFQAQLAKGGMLLTREAVLRQLPSFGSREMPPHVECSLLAHFGSAWAAWREVARRSPSLAITPTRMPLPWWREKATPFLGRLPDAAIGNCCEMSADAVRDLRRGLGIPAHTVVLGLTELCVL